jgi:hypothetical protein
MPLPPNALAELQRDQASVAGTNRLLSWHGLPESRPRRPPGKIFDVLIEEVRFAADSLLEEAVLSELVSEAKFPESRDKFNGLRPNSLRIGTGNFFGLAGN